ncbi:excinuclease ABC subunit C [Psychromonas sp. CNPT3]|uniref:excinuclease ABC subunit UvrC n=1 Tax=Psychromonas sp. CNPT3 TaxID=314282 RepID=UPI00006E83E6|nr:excinuclease ABC subunit UvrC [Psychromonas sp. CNPT3]AGH80694.1 excinuclease ABC subunit C [Psychromonas sp. CNPT3]
MDLFDANAFLNTLTSAPGVYRMFDVREEVIYVGKAKNLKKRLNSYFSLTQKHPKTLALVSHIAHIEVTVTHTETEALILEHNFIKQYKPKYNILLRDDKSYPYLFLSAHKHPQLSLVRRKNQKRKGTYFGPYPSGSAVRSSLNLMNKLFPIRQCSDSYYANRSRACLQFQLKRCLAPCVKGFSEQEYSHQVALASEFLQGKSQQVIETLIVEMQSASTQLAFEKAAIRRDQIQSLKKVQEQQWVSGDIEQVDVLGLSYEQGVASFHLLFIRQGRILGSRNYFPKVPLHSSKDELLLAFLSQFYLSGQNGRAVPKEILLSDDFTDRHSFTALLSEYCDYKVQLKVDVRGTRGKFIALAKTNAITALSSHLAKKSSLSKRYLLLEGFLSLDAPIRRMECYDISHMMGEKTVASCVVFDENGAKKSAYRHFNIQGITPGDDYAAMAQVLSRRFKDKQTLENIPDVIFIDGGLGQLSQAEKVLDKLRDNLSLKWPLLVGIAKGVARKAGEETLILAQTHQILDIDSDSPALHLIQEIRDESHRFAILGHRGQRDKKRRSSTLENILGVGVKKRQQLLNHFGGLQGIKVATIDELAKLSGISVHLATRIYEQLHGHN